MSGIQKWRFREGPRHVEGVIVDDPFPACSDGGVRQNGHSPLAARKRAAFFGDDPEAMKDWLDGVRYGQVIED